MVQVERDVERRLVTLVRRAGGWAPKWVSPGTLGVPDRIVFLPGGRVLFVEVKRSGGRPRPSQEAVHRRMARLGVPVVIVDDADGFAAEYLGAAADGNR